MTIIKAAGAGDQASGNFFTYQLNQSLRFNDNDSARLSRTPSGDGNRQTFTISFWMKRANIGIDQMRILNSNYSTDGIFDLYFEDTDEIVFRSRATNTNGAPFDWSRKSVRKFRDTGSWYHIVIAVDVTVSSPSSQLDLFEFYVNGEDITSDFTNVVNSERAATSSQVNQFWNSTTTHDIGYNGSSQFFDGYLAEFHNVDGTALNATSFGETKDGVWVPKEYTGSHGTNGFYLPFDDTSAIGDDESSNTNDFTPNNLSASDVVPDSPTNNFCTLNPLAYGTIGTISEGNLKIATSTNNRGIHGTMPIPSSGKWYWELHVDSRQSGGGIYAGIGSNASLGYDEVAQPKGIFVSLYNQTVDLDNSTASSPYNSQGNDSVSNGDIFSFALDVDNQIFYVAKNGTYRGSSDPSAGTGGLDVSTVFTNAVTELTVCLTRGGSYNETYSINFGQDSKDVASANSDENGIGTFEYAVPTGFLCLCSSNAPDTTIGPGQSSQADDYFNTVLYTGTGASHNITGVGFQPDWVWVKRRSSPAYGHAAWDSCRGVTKTLVPNSTINEFTSSGVTSFDSDGFTIGSSYNESSKTSVAWNWKAGGAPTADNSAGNGATPTAGSVKIDGSNLGSALAGSLAATRLSANTTAGFSIVTWTAPNDNGTVAHGLSSAPEMILAKPLGNGTNWYVMHTPNGVVPANNVLNLDNTSAKFNPGVNHYNDTYPTSTVFSYGGYLGDDLSNDDKVAYCFHSVPGYSAVGSFVGNGNSDGVFVYTNFSVKWLMIKRTDTTGSWNIADAARSPFNEVDEQVQANLSNAESTTFDFDFLSNGFKARTTDGARNASGGTYIYLAFAGVPFKFANAR